MPPDRLSLPDAILLRPTLTAIFDTVKDEILVVTPVWPDKQVDARAAYARATARLDEALAELDKPLPKPAAATAPLPAGEIQSNMTKEEYFAVVARAKDYIRAGDVFQVVPSQRFRRAFTLPPFALYRALRRLNPSPFLYYLSLPGFSIVGSSPEILVRLRDGKVTIRPIAGTRPRGKTQAEDKALAEATPKNGPSI
jgi:anthranilate synthase component 1